MICDKILVRIISTLFLIICTNGHYHDHSNNSASNKSNNTEIITSQVSKDSQALLNIKDKISNTKETIQQISEGGPISEKLPSAIPLNILPNEEVEKIKTVSNNKVNKDDGKYSKDNMDIKYNTTVPEIKLGANTTNHLANLTSTAKPLDGKKGRIKKPTVTDTGDYTEIPIATFRKNNTDKTPVQQDRPSLIMPIFITIIVIPIIAVFGYLGLRRTQEAWNKRHYNRMDYLIDGMYND